jgi:putative endonuclease
MTALTCYRHCEGAGRPKQSMKEPTVYMMASQKNGTIYTGVTSNLVERVYAHKTDKFKGFTQRYGCKSLVFLERYARMQDAIAREKQIKA